MQGTLRREGEEERGEGGGWIGGGRRGDDNKVIVDGCLRLHCRWCY